MPELGWAKLSFAAVCQLLDDLFSVGSEGAFEQFAVAALLSALIDQNGQTGYTGYRIETKSLNASDRSSRTAGDIQILSGSQVVEAFEVTAGSWSRKLDVVKKTIKEHDLSRFHVVAHVPEAQRPAFLGEFEGLLRGHFAAGYQGVFECPCLCAAAAAQGFGFTAPLRIPGPVPAGCGARE